jgi:hypothetical protein
MIADKGAANEYGNFLVFLTVRDGKQSRARKRNGQEELSSHH